MVPLSKLLKLWSRHHPWLVATRWAGTLCPMGSRRHPRFPIKRQRSCSCPL